MTDAEIATLEAASKLIQDRRTRTAIDMVVLRHRQGETHEAEVRFNECCRCGFLVMDHEEARYGACPRFMD